MNSPPWNRRSFVGALVGSTAFFGAPWTSAAAPTARIGKSRISVTREENGSFKIDRPGSPTLRVTFLMPTMLRVTILQRYPSTSPIPDYVRVKPSRSYPPVDVKVYPTEDEVTFETGAAIFNVAAADEVFTMDLQTPEKVLIDEWEVDAGELVARIELQSGERIYGFGDKRA